MSLGTILTAAADDRKRVVVYAPGDEGTDLADALATRNLDVYRREIPALSADAFVVIRDGSGFRGAVSLTDLLAFLAPPIRRPTELDDLDPAYRAIYELLDNTVFVSLDRRQLLATSRELEERAWRLGRGRLHVGFQSSAAFEAQADLYREMANATRIDIHVYVPPEGDTTHLDDAPLTVHAIDGELERYWFILFDDEGTGAQNCALVAEQQSADRYRGVWTYDPELVEVAFAAIE
ncbi:DICT sensory domain-containing protein [Haloarcula marina]|uniref:DICT sensory domain-containing protein n=1 Tax=Haloarcula marina TaxID=2961574 RepID=UPI0020B68697|nr:DICT sensory domain-containing protein [Halomicroarcula marina]